MTILSKSDFIALVAKETNLEKTTTEQVVSATLDTLMKSLKDGKEVRFMGFGSFSVQHSKAREGRNPRTGETIKIAASNKPVFKAGKEFKDAVN